MSGTLGDVAYLQVQALSDGGKIKGMVTLTQAQYDALPASKLTDGILYLIKG